MIDSTNTGETIDKRLADLRAQIDANDVILTGAYAERMALVGMIALIKKDMRAEVIQPLRHEEVRSSRTAMLVQGGVDPGDAANFVSFLLGSSVGVQAPLQTGTEPTPQLSEPVLPQLSPRDFTMAW